MKIGLFGGTFDPIHIGHLILAQQCWYQLDLDKIIFIPVSISPYKQDDTPVSPSDRLNMLRLALEGDKRFGISTYEIDKGGVSYTIDTVKYFLDTGSDEDEYFFICGSDAVNDLSGWKDPDRILDAVKFAAANRYGTDLEGPRDKRILAVYMPIIDVSSSNIRKRIREKAPIDFLVPDKVVKYIRNKGLYRQ